MVIWRRKHSSLNCEAASGSAADHDPTSVIVTLDRLAELASVLASSVVDGTSAPHQQHQQQQQQLLELWLACAPHEHLGDLEFTQIDLDTFTPIDGARASGENDFQVHTFGYPLGDAGWWLERNTAAGLRLERQRPAAAFELAPGSPPHWGLADERGAAAV